MARTLKHIPQGAGDLGDTGLAGIASIHQHAPCLRLEQPDRMFDKSGLARAIWTQDGDHIAAPDLKVESMQHIDPGLVSERDPFKPDEGFPRAFTCHAWKDLDLGWSRVLPGALESIFCGQFHLMVVHYLRQP